MLNKWMHEKRMYLLNKAGVPTCIRPQGSSTVDLTLANGGAVEGITDWAVVAIESLSDHHVPITSTYRETSCVERNKYVKEYFTRWNINKCNCDLFEASFAFLNVIRPAYLDRIKKEKRVRVIMKQACDVAMPRKGQMNWKKYTYWWNNEINTLRTECTRARCVWTRCRKKYKNLLKIDRDARCQHNLQLWTTAKHRLRQAIRLAKEKAWKELVDDTDREPWSMSYRIVRNKLKDKTMGLTLSMSVRSMTELLTELLPFTNRACMVAARAN